ncbi:TlpA family protein disulfide reductase [Weeksellaceae bacterium TAE3-ERU29]|nr:TlpA family protein disulfide reductase [Weeksellaceae bacterium TAE3-ERU29]
MRRIFLAAVLLVSFMGQAQFNVAGELKNYEQKPVILRVYDNGIIKFLTKVETDKNGKFMYKVPFAYNGLMHIELGNNAYQLISDNSDIDFTLNVNDPIKKIDFKKGEVNQALAKYNEYKAYLDIRDNMLSALESFYNSGQPFYEAIVKEKQRINNLKPVEIKNSNLNYYLNTQQLLDTYANSTKPEEVKKEILNHLANDGIEMESFGFLQPFVTQYLSNSVKGAQTLEGAKENLKSSVDQLLDKVGEETARAQSILLTVINMLQGSNFKDVAKEYKSRAESLTCEITPELKQLLQGDKNIQVGKKVPNIVFDKAVKGKKSLYDIKADKKLILFWGSWCGHCKREMPFVKEFYKGFKKSGGEIVAFAVDLNKNDYEEWVKDAGWYNYSDLLKWDSPVIKEFGINGTPTFILVDKNNKVIKTGSRVSEFVDLSN